MHVRDINNDKQDTKYKKTNCDRRREHDIHLYYS